MNVRLGVAISLAAAVAAGGAWGAGSTLVRAQSRTYKRTVTAEGSGSARRHVWTLGVAHRDDTLTTSLTATVGPTPCDAVLEAIPERPQGRINKVNKIDGFTLKMKCPDSYELRVRGGKVLTDTLSRRPAVQRELNELAATLDGYSRSGSNLRFTAKGDEGGMAINWACEAASLKALVSCATNPLGCGDDVEKQFCACAPKVDNAPKCGS